MTDPTPPPDPSTAAAALAAVAARLAAATRLDPATDDPILAAIAATAATVLDAQAASVAVHDPTADRLIFVAAAGPAAGEVVGLSIDAAAGIAGYVFSTGQPLAVADVQRDPRFDRSVAEATGYTPRSLLATPLTDERGTIGVLEVLDRRDGTFSMRDLDLGAALAREATIIVRRGRLDRDARRLLQAALSATAASADGATLTDDQVEVLVTAATERLGDDPDDPTWRLADRVARLVGHDPDRVELAIDWLDALLRHERR